MFTLGDIDGGLVWLLDVVIGGHDWRFTSDRGVVQSRHPIHKMDPRLYDYLPGLEWTGELDDTIDPFGDSPGDRSAEFNLKVDGLQILIEDGLNLGAGRGILSLGGRDGDHPIIMIDGWITDVSYSRDGVAVCTIEEADYQDQGRYPGPNQRVTPGAWPNASDKAIGEHYPDIIGSPGGSDGWGSAGLLVDTTNNSEILLIAVGEVEATTVDIIDQDDVVWAAVPVSQVEDGNGVVVSIASFPAAGAVLDDVHFVRWNNGGGRLLPDGTLLTGAGDVLRWMLSFSRLRTDHGRIAGTVARLNEYRIDTAIQVEPNTRITPWDWVADHLLPILPVTAKSSPDGRYLSLYPIDPNPIEAVAHLIQGTNATMVGEVGFSSRDRVVNDFELAYASDPYLDKYTQRVGLTGDQEVAAVDKEVSLNLHCIRSRSEYIGPQLTQENEWESITTDVIWDTPTASAILAWMAQHYSYQSRLVSYMAPIDIVHAAEPGSVVIVTDPGMGWHARPAVVENLKWSMGKSIEVSLRLGRRINE